MVNGLVSLCWVMEILNLCKKCLHPVLFVGEDFKLALNEMSSNTLLEFVLLRKGPYFGRKALNLSQVLCSYSFLWLPWDEFHGIYVGRNIFT